MTMLPRVLKHLNGLLGGITLLGPLLFLINLPVAIRDAIEAWSFFWSKIWELFIGLFINIQVGSPVKFYLTFAVIVLFSLWRGTMLSGDLKYFESKQASALILVSFVLSIPMALCWPITLLLVGSYSVKPYDKHPVYVKITWKKRSLIENYFKAIVSRTTSTFWLSFIYAMIIILIGLIWRMILAL